METKIYLLFLNLLIVNQDSENKESPLIIKISSFKLRSAELLKKMKKIKIMQNIHNGVILDINRLNKGLKLLMLINVLIPKKALIDNIEAMGSVQYGVFVENKLIKIMKNIGK